MESRHNLDGLILERKYVDARIVDSPYGYKMAIPIFNKAVASSSLLTTRMLWKRDL